MKIILFFILTVLYTVKCRKYDIEAESMKLYGEGLNSVLLRFRKTPEYLEILQEKVDDMHMEILDLISLTAEYYREEMYDKLAEEMSAPEDVRNRLRSSNSHRLHLRQESSRKMTPVERLDSYSQLHSELTVTEQNHFTDLGFEYAGLMIHAIIEQLGGEEAKSTQQPSGGEKDPRSTTVEHDHKVKSSSDLPITVRPDDTTTDQAKIRVRNRALRAADKTQETTNKNTL